MLQPVYQRKQRRARRSTSSMYLTCDDHCVYTMTPGVETVARLVGLSHGRRRPQNGDSSSMSMPVLVCSTSSTTPSTPTSTSTSTPTPIPPSSATPPRKPVVQPRKKDDSMTTQKQLASLLAGGIAGSLSATVTCPMEVVKTHLQASKGVSEAALTAKGPFSVARNIARVEGARGFFRGLTPTLIGILPARATYFWAYATTKGSLSQRFGESPLVHMLSAAAAGVTSNTLTNPIWLMKSRVQLQAGASSSNPLVYRGYRDAMYRIMREEGIGGFFKGLTASYWGVTEGALHFVVYERIKKNLIESNKQKLRERSQEELHLQGAGMMNNRGGVINNDPEQLSSIQYLTAAAFAKLIASAATYPHEVVRLRMREQPRFIGAAPKYTGMIQALKLIAKEEGRRGLYAGMGTHLARVVPNAALMFFTYEVAVKWIEKQQLQQEQQQQAKVSSSK